MDEKIKQQLVSEFCEYIDAGAYSGNEPDDQERVVDLYSLLQEFVALKTEVKIEARQFKSALDKFQSTLDHLTGEKAYLSECLEQSKASVQKGKDAAFTKRVTGFLHDKLRRPVVRTVGGRPNHLPDGELRHTIIDCANQVYLVLGEGLMLSAYEDCLSREMSLRDLDFKRNFPVPVFYKGLKLRDCGQLSHLVEEKVAVLLCPASREIDRYERRCANWIRLGGWPSGLLIDFDVG